MRSQFVQLQDNHKLPRSAALVRKVRSTLVFPLGLVGSHQPHREGHRLQRGGHRPPQMLPVLEVQTVQTVVARHPRLQQAGKTIR